MVLLAFFTFFHTNFYFKIRLEVTPVIHFIEWRHGGVEFSLLVRTPEVCWLTSWRCLGVYACQTV